jgi:hypothetical protein
LVGKAWVEIQAQRIWRLNSLGNKSHEGERNEGAVIVVFFRSDNRLRAKIFCSELLNMFYKNSLRRRPLDRGL